MGRERERAQPASQPTVGQREGHRGAFTRAHANTHTHARSPRSAGGGANAERTRRRTVPLAGESVRSGAGSTGHGSTWFLASHQKQQQHRRQSSSSSAAAVWSLTQLPRTAITHAVSEKNTPLQHVVTLHSASPSPRLVTPRPSWSSPPHAFSATTPASALRVRAHRPERGCGGRCATGVCQLISAALLCHALPTCV